MGNLAIEPVDMGIKWKLITFRVRKYLLYKSRVAVIAIFHFWPPFWMQRSFGAFFKWCISSNEHCDANYWHRTANLVSKESWKNACSYTVIRKYLKFIKMVKKSKIRVKITRFLVSKEYYYFKSRRLKGLRYVLSSLFLFKIYSIRWW